MDGKVRLKVDVHGFRHHDGDFLVCVRVVVVMSGESEVRTDACGRASHYVSPFLDGGLGLHLACNSTHRTESPRTKQ